MKYQLTAKDAPKIAVVLILLLSLGTFAVVKAQKAEAQREDSAMIKRMNRELGVQVEFSDSTEEPGQKQKEETDREIASASGPNKSTR